MIKGSKMTLEQRQRLSESHKGKPSPKKGKKTGKHSWNWGKRIPYSPRPKMKGHMPWNKGRPMDEESRKKSREAHKGQIAWNKGKTGIYSEETRKKIGLAGKGRTPWNKSKTSVYSEETKRQMSASHKRTYYNNPEARKRVSEFFKEQVGEKHPNWRGGISFEPYSLEWTKALKKLVRERDNYTCQICHNAGKWVHHIDYNKKNCDSKNLITLCLSCHAKTDFNREKWLEFFKRKS